MNETIIAMNPKLGDGLYCLPVASWIAKERGCKIHWVISEDFGPFKSIGPLLKLQPFTSRVTVVPHKYDNYGCGGQPVINLAEWGMDGYSLGFRSYPDKYISAFYAEEYGLDWDREFRLRLDSADSDTYGHWMSDGLHGTSGEALRSTESAVAKLVPHATPMGTHEDLLTLARRMAAAKEVHTWFCGLAILCAMAHIPVTVHRVPGHAYIPLYYRGNETWVKFVEHEESEVR